jgi:hypothetical protein
MEAPMLRYGDRRQEIRTVVLRGARAATPST